ncbi:BA75_01335T0 [Komagataella pastoris]|uniref:BA75_01335T0 n=1 Tax=Komagataella pastoris TaxID=4922 RepID=A0A1B2J7I9_PICPA|nr:BA75_01335T0 [Komagataella pastoris]
MLASRRRYASEDSYRSYRGGYRDYYYDRYSDRGYHQYSGAPHPRYTSSDYDEGYYSYDHYYGPEPSYDYRDGYYNDRRSGPSSRDPRDYDPDYYRGYHPQDRHYYSSRRNSRDYQRDRNYEHPQDYEGKAPTAYYRDRYPVRGPSRKDGALPAARPPNADGRSPVASEERDSSTHND